MLFERYLEFRQQFAVSRDLVMATVTWAEPLARKALGVHAERDQIGLGEKLQLIPVFTTAEDNGGWGELMPVWFKPYERPLPLFVLDNWALLALLYEQWLGEIGPEYKIENLLKIFVGGDILIPFLPATQSGGNFLRHGALTVLLGTLWLQPEARDAFIAGNAVGAERFAGLHELRNQADSSTRPVVAGQALAEYMAQVEFEAFFVAEGARIGGVENVRAFLADEARFETYSALFGALCLSLSALYDRYGPDWEAWVFQVVNVHYRLANFSLEAWANWLGIEYVEPPSEIDEAFVARPDHNHD